MFNKTIIFLYQNDTEMHFLLKLYKFTPGHTPKIVILVPTRELVVQVVEEVEKLTKWAKERGIEI